MRNVSNKQILRAQNHYYVDDGVWSEQYQQAVVQETKSRRSSKSYNTPCMRRQDAVVMWRFDDRSRSKGGIRKRGREESSGGGQ